MMVTDTQKVDPVKTILKIALKLSSYSLCPFTSSHTDVKGQGVFKKYRQLHAMISVLLFC